MTTQIEQSTDERKLKERGERERLCVWERESDGDREIREKIDLLKGLEIFQRYIAVCWCKKLPKIIYTIFIWNDWSKRKSGILKRVRTAEKMTKREWKKKTTETDRKKPNINEMINKKH